MSKMTANQLQGVFPALFTPLNDDDAKKLNNTIDYEKAKLMIDDLIESGVNGIVPVGTTGQSATLSTQQHLDFIKFTADYVNGRVPIIAGAGSNCTRESVEIINKVQEIGEIPVLCVTGYYNNPEINGIIKHFKTLASETNAQIVLYNVPGRTGSYLTPDAIIELAQLENIIGLKQAVDFKEGGKYRADTIKIIEATKDMDFNVVTGEDDALAAILEIGGKGIITATGNIPEVAKSYVEICKNCGSENLEEARRIQASLSDLISACFSRKNPIPLGTFFNSPMFLPMQNVIDTENGQEAHDKIMHLIETQAKSLKKYH